MSRRISDRISCLLGIEMNGLICIKGRSRWALGCVATYLLSLSLVSSAWAAAEISEAREIDEMRVYAPVAIYVSDFELDVEMIQLEPGLLLVPSTHPLRLPGIVSKLAGIPENPAVRARELIDLMAVSLVRNLAQAGLKASRLPPSELIPGKGWLLRGVFVEIGEENRVRRAAIGFGVTKTDLHVIISLDNVAEGSLKPFYELDTKKGGKLPTGKFADAAKYALGGFDVEKAITQTAAVIANDIVRRLEILSKPVN